jgi:hypothetical protein
MDERENLDSVAGPGAAGNGPALETSGCLRLRRVTACVAGHNSVVRVARFMLGLVLLVCLAGVLSACGGGGAHPLTTNGVAGTTETLRNTACDPNPRAGVHGPDRLKVVTPCATFQGTVNEAPVKNPDGDVSFQASPDPGYASFLNAQNRREGGLHIEIVPRDQPGCTPGQPVHAGDVPDLGTCSGRDVVAPAVGAHVRIVGSWVLDRNNGWFEIHPTWSIQPAGCRVPRVIGQSLRRARAMILRNLCVIGKIAHRPSRERLKGRVIGVRPRPGSLLPGQAPVNLTIGLGRRS